MVKHHRIARLPVDKAGCRARTSTVQRTAEQAFAVFLSRLGVRHKAHKLQQTANLWENHRRREL